MRFSFTSISAVIACLLTFPAHADRYPLPKDPLFIEECGSCHVLYPPQMLDAKSWQTLMTRLTDHFGADASLDEKQRLLITTILVSHAGGRKTGNTTDAAGKPLLRITETARFIRKHREINSAIWQRTSIKSPANCSACHTEANTGQYSDHYIKIPK